MTITVNVGIGNLSMSSDNLAIQSLMETIAAKLKYLSPYDIEEHLDKLKTPEDIQVKK